MYGVQNTVFRALQAHTTMRFHSLRFDASKFIATGKAFSGFAVMQPGGAGLQARRGVHVGESLKHQGNIIRSKCEALTMHPSGPANTPLRSVSAVH